MNIFRFLFYSIIITIGLSNCKQNNSSLSQAEEIFKESIQVSGGEVIGNSTLSFHFRNRQYRAIRSNGQFNLERKTIDSVQIVIDRLSNNGFKRIINDEVQKIPDSMASKYANSVNSVHYFSVLPFGLDNPAVNAQYFGIKNIKEKEYHKIEVTFDEVGGGEDFEDVFIYWIGKDDYELDYLAYSFHVNGGGIRFREAYNERYIKGIRFVDYYNYKPKNQNSKLIDMDDMFTNNNLDLVSKIELENVTVE